MAGSAVNSDPHDGEGIKKTIAVGARPPGVDLLVDTLIEPTDRPRAHPRAPQRLGDVFHPAHAYPRQIPSRPVLLRPTPHAGETVR